MITSWLRSHSTAILATAISVAKAGAFGKGALVVVSAIAVACGQVM